MLKRSKKILLLALGVLLISGCKAKSETSMIINNDKSIDIKGVIGLDDELIDTMISMDNSSSLDDFEEVEEHTDLERRKYLKGSFEEEQMNSIKEAGFDIQEYEDETYMGYIMSKKLTSIDDYVGDNVDVNISDLQNSNDEKFFTKNGNIYKGNFKFNDMENQEGTTSYNIEFDYKFILVLPNKAIKSNATTVSDDGKTLTWDLTNSSSSTIEFEFEFPTFLTMLKDNMFIVAGIAVAVVIIIVIIVTLIIMKTRKGKKNKGDKILKEQTSILGTQPKIQPVMPESPVVSAQPEVQPVIPQEPVVSVQPEVQPVMTQEPVVSAQPEVQPVIPQEPVVSVQPEIQPVTPQEPVVSVQPEVQPVIPQEPVVSVQPEVQPVTPQEPVVSAQPEVQPVIPQEPVVSAQPETQAVTPQELVVSAQPGIQPVMPQGPVVSVQPEVQPAILEGSVVSAQPEIKQIRQDPVAITDSETQPINNDQVINPQPLFPQDIIPPKDYN